MRKSVNLQTAFLACGLLSSLLYIMADVIASFLWKDYQYTSQTVSELFAIDAPTRTLVVVCFTFYSILICFFAAGVWLSSYGKRSLKFAAILIAGKELIGMPATFFFPIHLRGVEGNYSDIMHGTITAVGVFLFMFPAMIAGAIAFKGAFRIYSIITMILFIVFGIKAGLMQPQMSANLPTPMMGIFERINIYGYFLWIIIFSIMLLKWRDNNLRNEVN